MFVQCSSTALHESQHVGLAGASSLGRNVILSVSASKHSFKRAATLLPHPTLWQGHNCFL